MTSIIYYNRTKSIEEWANETLSGTELTDCLAAIDSNNRLWESYLSQNLISYEPIFDNVFIPGLESTVFTKVGSKTVLAPGVTISQIPMDPLYTSWYDRYSCDIPGTIELTEQ